MPKREKYDQSEPGAVLTETVTIPTKIDPETGRVVEKGFYLPRFNAMFDRIFAETELTDKQKWDKFEKELQKVFDRILAGTDSDDEQGPAPPARAERSEAKEDEPKQSSSTSGLGDSVPASPEEPIDPFFCKPLSP